MAIKRFEKTPEGALDYVVEWVDWMVETDTIDTSEWEIVPDDGSLSLDQGDIDQQEMTTTGWLSGGEVGVTYTVTNTITTSNPSLPRTTSRSFLLSVLEYRYLEGN